MKNLNDYKKRILVTGGAGFIGSHLVRHFVNKYPEYLIVNFDALTYAGNLENLKDIEDKDNYEFFVGDIRHIVELDIVFHLFEITDVIHLAAESHVDRSIVNPNIFAETNIMGTLNLLNTAREYWKDDYSAHRFHHVSTDEVYGALDMNPENKFTETTPYNPHSPYSASKASSDHLVKAYGDTFGMNVTISNCSNNYGPNQFPEKLIPLVINKLKEGMPIPVYGTGENVRDWLYVEDHAKAIDCIFHNGKSGETYNVGGNHEMKNIDIIKTIILKYSMEEADSIVGDRDTDMAYASAIDGIINKNTALISYVTDRAGHDLRYAIDATKIKNELGWQPEETFESGIAKTIKWYLDNWDWVERCKSGEYQNWIKKNYDER